VKKEKPPAAPADPSHESGQNKLTSLLRHVRQGATAIWLQVPAANSRVVTNGAFPFAPKRQQAKGKWIPVNHYTRPHAAFEGLPAGGFMGQAYQNVRPPFTLLDLPGAPLASRVSWGYTKDYTGPTEVWHGADLTVVAHGRGRPVLSTFNLIEYLGTDPVADKPLLNLCRWSAADGQPSLER